MTDNVLNSTRFVVVLLSTLCNLKCKHCITFTPYQARPRNFQKEEIKADISRFFQIFHDIRLQHIDFGGGEPFLHPDLVELAAWMLDTHHKQFDQLRILSNGSREFPPNLLDLCANGDVFFLIDNYGPALSPNADRNAAILAERDIPYRVNKYHGDGQYFNGWVDFGDLSYKNYTAEQLEEIRLNCSDLFSVGERGTVNTSDHLHIKDGKIYTCDMQQVGAKHIPLLPDEYIDLRSNETASEIRERSQGNLDEAISLMSGLAAKSRKAASDLAQMQNIRSAKEILAKFSGE